MKDYNFNLFVPVYTIFFVYTLEVHFTIFISLEHINILLDICRSLKLSDQSG